VQYVRRVARRTNRYVVMRDHFGSIFCDLDFAPLYPGTGQPGYAPWRLALLLLVAYWEHLSDDGVAEQVGLRADLKYLLGLPLDAVGPDPSDLSRFRDRLIGGGASRLLFDTLLDRLRAAGLAQAGGRVRTDSTKVLANVHTMTRLALVRETMRHALEVLAEVAPTWLRAHAEEDWVARYEARNALDRLPESTAKRLALAQQIARDGSTLLTRLTAPEAPLYLQQVEAVRVLHRVWIEQFVQEEQGWRLREAKRDGAPPMRQAIVSPYDPDARRGIKRGKEWLGYMVHLSESCDQREDRPHLVHAVHLLPAPLPDVAAFPLMANDLEQRDLQPAEHVIDAGFLDAEHVVESRRDGVALVGPVRQDSSWQARDPDAFDHTHFQIAWDQQQVTCPAGKQSTGWRETAEQGGRAGIVILFARADCQPCPLRSRCTTSARRQLMLRPQAQYEVLQAARAKEGLVGERATYASRAGIEGTISQVQRRCAIHQARYRGRLKVAFQVITTAAALNFARTAAFLAGQIRAQTRTPRFSQLMAVT
jgi:transposase